MTYNPLKRDSSWQMVLPGCYIDPAGFAHLFPDEFLAFLSVAHPEAGFDPNSRDDYDLVADHFIAMLKKLRPELDVKVVVHERQEN